MYYKLCLNYITKVPLLHGKIYILLMMTFEFNVFVLDNNCF